MDLNLELQDNQELVEVVVAVISHLALQQLAEQHLIFQVLHNKAIQVEHLALVRQVAVVGVAEQVPVDYKALLLAQLLAVLAILGL